MISTIFLLLYALFFFHSEASGSEKKDPTIFSIDPPGIYQSNELMHFFRDRSNYKILKALKGINKYLDLKSSKVRLYLVLIFHIYTKILTDGLLNSSDLKTFEEYQLASTVLKKYLEGFEKRSSIPSVIPFSNFDEISDSLAQVQRFKTLFSESEYNDLKVANFEKPFSCWCLEDVCELGKFTVENLSGEIQNLDPVHRQKIINLFEKVKNRLKPVFNTKSRLKCFKDIPLGAPWASCIIDYPAYEFLCEHFSTKSKDAFDFIFFDYKDTTSAIIKDIDVLAILEEMKNDSLKALNEHRSKFNKFQEKKYNKYKWQVLKRFKETHNFDSDLSPLRFEISIPSLYSSAPLESYFSNSIQEISQNVAQINKLITDLAVEDRTELISLFHVYLNILTSSKLCSLNLEFYERYKFAKDALRRFISSKKRFQLSPGFPITEFDNIGELLAQISRFTHLFSKDMYDTMRQSVLEHTFIENCLDSIIKTGIFQPECLRIQKPSDEQQLLFNEIIKNNRPIFSDSDRIDSYSDIAPEICQDPYIIDYAIYEFLVQFYSYPKKDPFKFAFFNFGTQEPLSRYHNDIDILETWHIMNRKFPIPIVLKNDKEKFDFIRGEIVKKFKATHHKDFMLDAREISGTRTDSLGKSDRQDLPQIPIANNVPQISNDSKFQNQPPVPELIGKKTFDNEIEKSDKNLKDEKVFRVETSDLNNQPSPQPSTPKPDTEAVKQITTDTKTQALPVVPELDNKKLSESEIEKEDEKTDSSESETTSESSIFEIPLPQIYDSIELKTFFNPYLEHINEDLANINQFFDSIPFDDCHKLLPIFHLYFKIITESLMKSSNLETYERHLIAADAIREYLCGLGEFPDTLFSDFDGLGYWLAPIYRFESLFPTLEEYKDFTKLIPEPIFIKNCLERIIMSGDFKSECLALETLNDEETKNLAFSLYENIKDRVKPIFDCDSQQESYRDITLGLPWSWTWIQYPAYELFCQHYADKKNEAFDFIFFDYKDAVSAIIKDMDILKILEKLRDSIHTLINKNSNLIEKFNSVKGVILDKFKKTHHFESKPDDTFDTPEADLDPKRKLSSDKPDNGTDTLKSQTKKSSTDQNRENETKISDTDDLPQTPNNFKRNILIISLVLLVLAAIVVASALFIRFKRSQSERLIR
jgi:hypothetical protein